MIQELSKYNRTELKAIKAECERLLFLSKSMRFV